MDPESFRSLRTGRPMEEISDDLDRDLSQL